MLTSTEIRKFVEDNPRLVRVSKSKDYPGLYVIKYHNRAFYDNLWNKHPELINLRGLVVTDDYHVVMRPFDKIFNYKENGMTFDGDEIVEAVPKINGFLATARYVVPYGLVVSTTGTLDSDYAVLAYKHVSAFEKELKKNEDLTFMFEIVDPSDPHIIDEKPGAYLIGARDDSGDMVTNEELINLHLCGKIGDFCPEAFLISFEELLDMTKRIRHEGFVVSDFNGNQLKLKSPYYLSIKLVGRFKTEKMELVLKEGKNIPWLDEDYQWALDKLRDDPESFLSLDQYDRVEMVRKIIDMEMSK